MKKITPFLWFDTQAEEAMSFYVDTFNGAPYKQQESRIVNITRYEKGMEAPGADALEGRVITGIFELAGQRFMALDGGPIFKFTEAVSFFVECEDQKEVDYFWNTLTANGGEESMCGWLKDKYGLSWQIVPKQLGELMGDPNPEKSKRVMDAMLKMTRIIVADLQKAYDGA